MTIVERARTLRQLSTPTERTIWHWLRHRYLHGFKFRRQHPIGRYILDFYCPVLRLCIEVDGGVHDVFAKHLRDEQRTRELERLGITVLRLRTEYVREQPEGAWECIVAKVLELGAPHPSPLPARRGEGT